MRRAAAASRHRGRAVRIVVDAVPLARSPDTWIIVAGAYPVWLSFFQGQIVFLLLYPMTRAWRAYRAGDRPAAGLWLAPVIAVKPQIALLALMLPVSVWIVAGVGSGALTLAGVAVTGVAPWVAWLRIGGAITWLSWPDNAALWGIAARLETRSVFGGSMGTLPPGAIVAVGLAVLGFAVAAYTERDVDRRFTLAALASQLATPLGWVYYVVAFVGPLMAVWRSTWRAVWLLWVPLPVLLPLMMARPTFAAVVGSLYSVCLVAMFVAIRCAREPGDSGRA